MLTSKVNHWHHHWSLVHCGRNYSLVGVPLKPLKTSFTKPSCKCSSLEAGWEIFWLLTGFHFRRKTSWESFCILESHHPVIQCEQKALGLPQASDDSP
jgi:hypothetical protein